MRLDRIAATAVLAAAATAAAAGVVHAAPAAEPIAVQGNEQGIAFSTAPDADGRLVTTLESGAFAVSGGAVTLSDAEGRVVAALPLSVQTADGTVGLRPVVGAEGRTLTLTQVSDQGEVKPVDDAATTARKQYNAGVGALIGAGIGAVIGFFLGGVGALVTLPLGAGIGALIGFSTP